jgi:hypothetical protein
MGEPTSNKQPPGHTIRLPLARVPFPEAATRLFADLSAAHENLSAANLRPAARLALDATLHFVRSVVSEVDLLALLAPLDQLVA